MMLVFSTPPQACPTSSEQKASTTPKRHRSTPLQSEDAVLDDGVGLASKHRESTNTSSSRRSGDASTPSSSNTSTSNPHSPDSM
eukprot:5306033-Pleurochrysis_carterae.AAC.1